MDVEEARRLLFNRVKGFDAENAFKIMGYLLLQDWREQDLLGLALGSDVMLHSLIVKVKKELSLNNRTTLQVAGQSPSQSQVEINNLLSPQASTQPLMPVSPLGMKSSLNESFLATAQPELVFSKFCSYPSLHTSQVNERWLPPQMASLLQEKDLMSKVQQKVLVSPVGSSNMPHQHPLLILKDQSNFLQMPTKWPSPSHVEARSIHLNTMLTWKPCLFYSRGYCKHGSHCRFLHSGEKDFSSLVVPMTEDFSDGTGSDDGSMTIGSVDCLQQELKELLLERRTPVSIASLPQLYYEKFGKTLQADGYLTESQRHGKVGYSLTKLLMRLKGTITLIDRPHGQHAVVLNENAHKFNDFRGDQDDSSTTNSSSRQIYLTFPADSTFTEEDVTIHFSAYGPVQDVRIPYQQRRMFGFVTFLYAETVITILADGNPHYICGARVLVKPYKEKGKIGDRKSVERNQLRQTPATNLQSVSNEFKEDLFAHLEDETFPPLEKGIMGLQLSETRTQISRATSVASASCWQQRDGAPIADDDCFDLQSSAIEHVLDILEGESKEIDSPKYSTADRLDSSTLKCSFENPHVSETSTNTLDKISLENPTVQQSFSTTVDKMKSHNFGAQTVPLGQCSWGSPTFFARSVF